MSKTTLGLWLGRAGVMALATLLHAAPIPAGPDVKTSVQFKEHLSKMLRAISIDAYQEFGRRNDKWDKPAIEFLETHTFHKIHNSVKANAQRMLPAARKLVKLGCDDPLVLYCCANVEQISGDKRKALKLLRQIQDTLRSQGYDPLWSALAAKQLMVLEQLNESPAEQIERAEAQSIDCVVAAASSTNFGPGDQRVLYYLLANSALEGAVGSRRQYTRKVWERIEKSDGIDRWLKCSLGGLHHNLEGWSERGGGFAPEIKPEGWAGLEANMTKAAKFLMEAHALHPEWPTAASLMIDVAMAGYSPPGKDMRYWFDQAVAAEFDHLAAYSNLLWGLRPRWHGSHEELLAFGRECLDTGRFDTEVPYQLYEALRGIANDYYGDWEKALRMPGVYGSMIKMLDGYEKESQGKSYPRWYDSFRAAVAWRCGEYEDARKYLDLAAEHIRWEPFARVGGQWDEATGEIYARTGPWARQCSEAHEEYEQQNFTRAAEIFSELAAKDGIEPFAMLYFRRNAWLAQAKEELEAGHWVDLPIHKDLDAWRIEAGKWEVDEQGALTGTSTDEGLLLVCRLPIGPELEFSGEVESVKYPAPARANAGLFCSYVWPREHQSVILYPRTGVAAIRKNFRYGQESPAPLKAVNQMRVLVQESKVTAYVNGERIFDQVEQRWTAPQNHARVGVGGWYWFDGAVVKFRNLKVRRADLLLSRPE